MTSYRENIEKSVNRKVRRRSPPQNFFLKMLDTQYWKRLGRYLYIRFVRMRSTPRAIARGVAAGVFAGCFPFFGFQTIVGIALATLFRGNQVMAAAGTWISNPLTSLPIFFMNFHLGRWLLRLPISTDLPASFSHVDEWMAMGVDAFAALMFGSFIVGAIASVVSYYIGLVVARRVQAARSR
jgi:uncharacterized protein